MKKYFILLSIFVLIACQEDNIKEQKLDNMSTEASTFTIEKEAEINAEETDINGKWKINQVTGGPVKIYPSGKNNPDMEIDFNPLWKGSVFEFMNGVGFLTIPNLPQEQIGYYAIKGNSIIFENLNHEKQHMEFSLNDDKMTLSINSEAYQKLIAHKNNNQVAMDIVRPIVFHLSKQ